MDSASNPEGEPGLARKGIDHGGVVRGVQYDGLAYRDHVQRVTSVSKRTTTMASDCVLALVSSSGCRARRARGAGGQRVAAVQEHPRIAREAWPNMDLETRTSSFEAPGRPTQYRANSSTIRRTSCLLLLFSSPAHSCLPALPLLPVPTCSPWCTRHHGWYSSTGWPSTWMRIERRRHPTRTARAA